MPRQIPSHCKHFDGITKGTCRAGVVFDTLPYPGLPCVERFRRPDIGDCEKREMPTAEEIAASEAEDARIDDCLARGVSACCDAPLDDSRVIREGRHRGHGGRYCSKCGKVAFWV